MFLNIPLCCPILICSRDESLINSDDYSSCCAIYSNVAFSFIRQVDGLRVFAVATNMMVISEKKLEFTVLIRRTI